MANDNKNGPVQAPLASNLGAIASLASGNVPNELQAELLKALKIQNAKADEEERERLAAREIAKRAKMDLVAQQKREQEKQTKMQESCTHISPQTRASALVGIRVWDSYTPMYTCQDCMKVWDKDNPPPPGILPSGSAIGGYMPSAS